MAITYSSQYKFNNKITIHEKTRRTGREWRKKKKENMWMRYQMWPFLFFISRLEFDGAYRV